MDKAWYLSRTVWAGIIIAAYGIAISLGLPLEAHKELIISIASGLGIIGIRGALK